MNEIRLQLALAKAGLASRRHAEELIVAGRVAVNGKVVTQLGSRIDPVSDRITVDGKPVLREAPAYYLMNKPKGYVTTADDPEGRPTVFSLLKGPTVRLFSVGRLDYNTEGALLLTNDGELAHALMHPSRGVAKVYHAKFRGVVSREQLAMLRRGVDLPPARPLDQNGRPLPTTPGSDRVERSAPAQVTTISTTGRHTWLQFILHEGKNRQIHRMAEAVGSSLLKLLRVEYAGLSLQDLPVGEYRPLQSREVLELRQSVGLPAFVAQQGPVKPRARPEDAAPEPRERARASRAHDEPRAHARPGHPPRRTAAPESERPPRRAAWESASARRPPAHRADSQAESARRPSPRRAAPEPEFGRRPPPRRTDPTSESSGWSSPRRAAAEPELGRRPPPSRRTDSKLEPSGWSPPRRTAGSPGSAGSNEETLRRGGRVSGAAGSESGASGRGSAPLHPRRAAGHQAEHPAGLKHAPAARDVDAAPPRTRPLSGPPAAERTHYAPPHRPKRRELQREPPRELPPDWPPR